MSSTHNGANALSVLNGRLGALRTIFRQPLRTGAEGPLSGLSFAVKDAIEIAGETPGVGSRIAGRAPATLTAPVVQRLLDAGAAAVGMAHLVEFAFGGWGTNRALGTPVNPWSGDRPLTPGGSSSGSAVAVASGMVDFALGTDTGGSVRIPAAFCGLSGLRPSPGAVPLAGLVHISPTLDTIGPIARNARDCARLFRIMAGLPSKVETPADLAGLRLAIPSDDALGRVLEPIREAFEEAIETLRRLGASIVPERVTIDFAGDQAIAGAIISHEAYRAFGDIVERRKSEMDFAVAGRILSGRAVNLAAYENALAGRRRIIEGWARRFAAFDVLALPTLPVPAMPVEDVDEADLSPSVLTRFVGLADLCGLTVPMRPTPEGLPAGLQIVGANGADERVLGVGAAYQSVTDWHFRRPPHSLAAA